MKNEKNRFVSTVACEKVCCVPRHATPRHQSRPDDSLDQARALDGTAVSRVAPTLRWVVIASDSLFIISFSVQCASWTDAKQACQPPVGRGPLGGGRLYHQTMRYVSL